jgi:hypothetical protein
MEKHTLTHHRPSTKAEVKEALVVITFNSQKLLDLWMNELQGQLSDGAWENSDGANWLWHAAVKLGSSNKVTVKAKDIWSLNNWCGAHSRFRKSFSFFHTLCGGEMDDLDLSDRMMAESGFKTRQDLKAACKTVQAMVAAATLPTERFVF